MWGPLALKLRNGGICPKPTSRPKFWRKGIGVLLETTNSVQPGDMAHSVPRETTAISQVSGGRSSVANTIVRWGCSTIRPRSCRRPWRICRNGERSTQLFLGVIMRKCDQCKRTEMIFFDGEHYGRDAVVMTHPCGHTLCQSCCCPQTKPHEAGHVCHCAPWPELD